MRTEGIKEWLPADSKPMAQILQHYNLANPCEGDFWKENVFAEIQFMEGGEWLKVGYEDLG